MNLEEDIRKKFDKMQEIAEDRLHPPMAPAKVEKTEVYAISLRGKRSDQPASDSKTLAEPIASEIPVSESYEGRPAVEGSGKMPIDSGSKLSIDFSYLANNSSFQRAIIEFIKKYIPGFENVNPRGSKEVVTKSFNKNISNYRECMKELKEKIRGRKDER